MLSQENINQFPLSTFLSDLGYQRAWIEIDHRALAGNVRSIRQILAQKTQLMAVVKADAYGHGAVSVAKTVIEAGCHSLAVATLSEGIELRQAGVKVPILILGATNTASEAQAIAYWQLEPTLCNPQQALLYSQTMNKLQKTLPVHLKLDTGMSRLGVSWQQATDFALFVSQLSNLAIASIYSHLATADAVDCTMMRLQNERYQAAIKGILTAGVSCPCLHLANSAATLRDTAYHYDLVRVGLALYGLHPAPHLQSCLKLEPVLRVKARITQVKTIPANTGVSYGHQYISNKETRLAVVGVGYADGIPRNLSNKLQVLLRGQLVPQIGAITMDQLMLDVSAIPDTQVGEVVTLIGQQGKISLSANHWAENLGTIVWEILCGFKHRLPRIALP